MLPALLDSKCVEIGEVRNVKRDQHSAILCCPSELRFVRLVEPARFGSGNRVKPSTSQGRRHGTINILICNETNRTHGEGGGR